MNGEKLWKIIQRQDSDDELSEPVSIGASRLPRAGISRRTFIEMIGFSAAALALNGCRAPEQKVIPYLKQPVEFTPGVANWYASVCGGCSASCGTLVKVRDGRPIKLEGNPDHPLTGGGLCPVAHAMVFGLYDSERLRQPVISSKPASWDEVDDQIKRKLEGVKMSGGKVRLLTPTITGPTSKDTIARFLNGFADGKHIVYEAASDGAILQAHLRTHKTAAVPSYNFDRAKLIVSFDADFIGTWIAPVRFTRAYTRSRNLQDGGREMSRHVQFESRLSLTGSNADIRVTVSPDEEMTALLLLAKLVAAKTGAAAGEFASLAPSQLSARTRQTVEHLADELLKLRGESLVISGSNDVDAQCLVNFINHATGSYGKSLNLAAASGQGQGNDSEMVELVREMNAGQVAALILSGVNPAYDYYASREFTDGLAKVPLKISLNPTMDETSALVDYICPQHHFLESWDDAEPVRGIYSFNQPTIAPLFQTRAYQESLLGWSGDGRKYYDVLRESWREKLFPKQTKYTTFDEFWDRSLQDGVFELETQPPEQPAFDTDEIGKAAGRLKARAAGLSDGLSLVLYKKVALGDGAYANNPWLQELPDPITKITWDNYASISPALAEQMQIEEGTVVRISKGTDSIELPAHVQPGQHDRTIAIALGYGRRSAGKAGNHVGANAYPFVSFDNGTFQYSANGISIGKTTVKVELASTQRHGTLDGKPIIKEFTLADYIEGTYEEGEHAGEHQSIWRDHEYGEHKWGMVIDLNACTGCSACILSCQAENNVPVVGRDEVRRQREMHWLRLDRYYEGEGDATTVSYQPMLCAQCDNASCESVCPVLATVHSSEGLNMQVYNRCVGTRYCANNCPYKVRRFNWFENERNDPIANLALNPDVTVRTRGVMEKCTFCVQRIEDVKIKARNEGRAIRDGEVQTACQQSCPASAITFGDLVNEKSRVNILKHDERDYILLEELNLRPAVSYLAKVRNTEEA
ncbi:MAG TPA: 4Fe-4S dicluster domain-containing protein [Blastocatellia bacterium]|nr:4Fe-4S dicluster domain-containing protein [Blastocatellia bacterium]